MFDLEQFKIDMRSHAIEMSRDEELKGKAFEILCESRRHKYAYQFSWLGLPIIQLPQDVFITQQILADTKPDVFIETGVAWGGSVLFHANVMKSVSSGKVIAVDMNIPEHVFNNIKERDRFKNIHLIQGDSTSIVVIEEIKRLIPPGASVGVFLDSNHSHDHVLMELNKYGLLVTEGQFLSVYATAIENLPVMEGENRPWGRGNNPQTAINEFLSRNSSFEIVRDYDDKLLSSFVFGGRLRKRKASL